MFFLALFVLVFHCFIKPYKKEASNLVETLILLNLLLVAAAYLEAPEDRVASLFIVILTVLPYLYAVVFLIWVTCKKMYASQLYYIDEVFSKIAWYFMLCNLLRFIIYVYSYYCLTKRITGEDIEHV